MPRRPVGNALDQAEGSGGGAERGGEQTWEQGGGNLVSHVGQEAGRTDARYPGPSQRSRCPVVASLMAAVRLASRSSAL
jgi:hypothetical protein